MRADCVTVPYLFFVRLLSTCLVHNQRPGPVAMVNLFSSMRKSDAADVTSALISVFIFYSDFILPFSLFVLQRTCNKACFYDRQRTIVRYHYKGSRYLGTAQPPRLVPYDYHRILVRYHYIGSRYQVGTSVPSEQALSLQLVSTQVSISLRTNPRLR